MTEISSLPREPSLLSARTADYVAALIRQGDDFDYSKWLHEVQEKEAGAKQLEAASPSGELVTAEIGKPMGTSDNQHMRLRYVAHCKPPKMRVEVFMKSVGGINACGDRYAKRLRKRASRQARWQLGSAAGSEVKVSTLRPA
jgi:hypothetical protein